MSSKKTKGLSFEEKRKRACDYLLEKRDFFQLKDLEKYLPKEKGVVAQTVKEVIQSLVDDRLVNMEKIGTSNYFWSFPSTAMQSRKAKIETSQIELAKLQQTQKDLEKQIDEAQQSRPDGDDRRHLMNEFQDLESKFNQNCKELEQFKEFDPDLFDEKKKQMQIAKEATDRWTDNIFAIQSYCVSNFGISRSEFASQFGISEDLDYVQ